METDDVKRLRDLEAENAALKRIVADRALVIDQGEQVATKKVDFGPRPTDGGHIPNGRRIIRKTRLQGDGNLSSGS